MTLSVTRFVVAVLFATAMAPALACTVSTTSVAFGSINPLAGAATDSTGSITVTCPSLTSYTVALSGGSGTVDNRHMTSGSNVLRYQLYTDATRQQVWGDGTAGTVTVAGSASDTGTSHTVYGQAPSQSLAVPGSYSDQVVVTITW